VTIERAGADDLAMGALSTHGRVPQQFGVVLLLEPGGDAAAVRRIAADRLGVTPDEMDGGHLPALARPEELAARLVALAQA
jgi:hypothetical protein